MQQMQTTVGRWCERIAEACWLLALTIIPLYFNLYSARHFEPDKAIMLRSLALVALAAVVIRALDQLIMRGEQPARAPDPDAPAPPPAWRRMLQVPLAVPTLLYIGVFLFTTITSVVPLVSFWGSYQRMQGTYTNISYIMLAFAIVAVVQRREQVERIVTLSILTAVAVASYGIMQHLRLDPLPWQGDVVIRIASTMGNAIFVAAYMIMVLPFALYRMLIALGAMRKAQPATGRVGNELLWTLARGLLLVAGFTLLLAMLKFGAVVRTVDFRYWWVLPGAISCATALWWLLTTNFDRPGSRIALWPGLLVLGYMLFFGFQFAASADGNVQMLITDGTAERAQDWWAWLLAAGLATAAGYALALLLPQRLAQTTRLGMGMEAAAAGVATIVILAAIFFTQSRGPWLGLAAGGFVFLSLALWQGLRRAKAQGMARERRLLQGLLGTWVALNLAGGAFLIAFNLSDAPFFEELREVPYLGRMGQLLEVDDGTGLVRVLIWRGDEHAGGSVALIQSDPLRTLIGWGPESMFVAFNPFYPPALANIEARGASPDRAHQAQIDELITRGFLGFASHIFLLLSFGLLSWRLLHRSNEWRWQLFFIACLSAVVCHIVEGFTGIPIVSTLMMFWVVLGITVAGGALAGHYQIMGQPAAAAVAAEPPAAPTNEAPPRQGAVKRRGAAGRGAGVRPAAPRSLQKTPPAGAFLAYGLVAFVALIGVVVFNLNPIRADMRFQQGQSAAQRTPQSAETLTIALTSYLDTVRLNPREDFYYLNLGRVLMSAAEVLRAQGIETIAAVPNVSVESLLQRSDQNEVVAFIQQGTPGMMLSYAEAVLLRAHALNPLNKDHYANLGRLHTYWFRWTNDRAHLEEAAAWYARVTPIAPQDVILLNERAATLMALGDYTRNAGEEEAAQGYYEQAAELLQQAASFDQRYADTFVRLGDLARNGLNDLDLAVENYLIAIRLSHQPVSNAIENISSGLAERRDLIMQLHEVYAELSATREAQLAERMANDPNFNPASMKNDLALLHAVTGLLAVRGGETALALEPYERASELDPTSFIYSRNYALILSDTLRHDAAISETHRLIDALQGLPDKEQNIAESEQLIRYFEFLASQ
ncbi:hypothetical protein CJ255_01040 [Candidatus Viridilinea mediisalina]|uniref:Tetratricopeptide repeat protein n=2 Tax=Candidatus Viridilinea mediisalina TaxID=2024553 RepID=A0A2A6RPK7_9CHLR|nr:hypothetical protein CJ255_01040 [Candidatus Viridilinea mediisalina]